MCDGLDAAAGVVDPADSVSAQDGERIVTAGGHVYMPFSPKGRGCDEPHGLFLDPSLEVSVDGVEDFCHGQSIARRIGPFRVSAEGSAIEQEVTRAAGARL